MACEQYDGPPLTKRRRIMGSRSNSIICRLMIFHSIVASIISTVQAWRSAGFMA
jgi:hypothetical protein